MAEFFLMPQASPTMDAGRVLSWLVSEGDKLNPQDVLAEVETDKAAMEIEVFDPCVVLKILVPAGTEAKVDSPIAIIGDSVGEDISALMAEFEALSAAAPAAEPAPEPAAPVAAPAATKPVKAPPIDRKTVAPAPGSTGVTAFTWQGAPVHGSIMEMPTDYAPPTARVRSAPAARRLAAELGVSLSEVTGSGPHGRVMSEDVRAAADSRSRRVSSTPTAPTAASETIPHSNMRKTIARRLKAVYLDAPTFFLTATLNCDAMVGFRGQLKAAGVKVSYNDIIIKAAALALRDVPAVNASWSETAITRHGRVDIGMAVALDGGLITPVIRSADTLGLSTIATQTRELAGRARELKLKPAEYQNSTFTISNLGMMQIEHFTAIINAPDSAILAVGSLRQEPVVVDGVLSVGWRMKVTMTCDHRVIDGALGASFLQALRKYIENPALLAA
ncbi:MAG: pyruvate dehydrogenase E2 component (dihydrolipoamide acetyltransferase) [Myxococcota bacterium]|jgi:pyruvate dehydrogenase E2 component (dihydrolipoamide acetyltransferase)